VASNTFKCPIYNKMFTNKVHNTLLVHTDFILTNFRVKNRDVLKELSLY
jgi:hypothetical protein